MSSRIHGFIPDEWGYWAGELDGEARSRTRWHEDREFFRDAPLVYRRFRVAYLRGYRTGEEERRRGQRYQHGGVSWLERRRQDWVARMDAFNARWRTAIAERGQEDGLLLIQLWTNDDALPLATPRCASE